MEKYLNRCLDSLLIPELDEVEVLVVNDGSKDRSSEIAHEYEKRYPNSFRVIDKENGNYGSCINAALPLATGRYVKILDADDRFDKVAFSNLINYIKKCNFDVILTPYEKRNQFNELIEIRTLKNLIGKNEVSFTQNFLNEYLPRGAYMHQITYNSSIFRKFQYHQTEGISYTDSEWSIVPLCHAQTFSYLEAPVYQYLEGREGQTMEKTIMKKKTNNFFSVLNSLIDNNINFNGSPEVQLYFKNLVIMHHEIVYQRVFSYHDSNYLNLLKEYDKNLKIKNPEIFIILGTKKLYKNINFCLINEIRLHEYSSHYKIPLNVKILNKLFNLLSRN